MRRLFLGLRSWRASCVAAFATTPHFYAPKSKKSAAPPAKRKAPARPPSRKRGAKATDNPAAATSGETAPVEVHVLRSNIQCDRVLERATEAAGSLVERQSKITAYLTQLSQRLRDKPQKAVGALEKAEELGEWCEKVCEAINDGLRQSALIGLRHTAPRVKSLMSSLIEVWCEVAPLELRIALEKCLRAMPLDAKYSNVVTSRLMSMSRMAVSISLVAPMKNSPDPSTAVLRVLRGVLASDTAVTGQAQLEALSNIHRDLHVIANPRMAIKEGGVKIYWEAMQDIENSLAKRCSNLSLDEILDTIMTQRGIASVNLVRPIREDIYIRTMNFLINAIKSRLLNDVPDVCLRLLRNGLSLNDLLQSAIGSTLPPEALLAVLKMAPKESVVDREGDLAPLPQLFVQRLMTWISQSGDVKVDDALTLAYEMAIRGVEGHIRSLTLRALSIATWEGWTGPKLPGLHGDIPPHVGTVPTAALGAQVLQALAEIVHKRTRQSTWSAKSIDRLHRLSLEATSSVVGQINDMYARIRNLSDLDERTKSQAKLEGGMCELAVIACVADAPRSIASPLAVMLHSLRLSYGDTTNVLADATQKIEALMEYAAKMKSYGVAGASDSLGSAAQSLMGEIEMTLLWPLLLAMGQGTALQVTPKTIWALVDAFDRLHARHRVLSEPRQLRNLKSGFVLEAATQLLPKTPWSEETLLKVLRLASHPPVASGVTLAHIDAIDGTVKNKLAELDIPKLESLLVEVVALRDNLDGEFRKRTETLIASIIQSVASKPIKLHEALRLLEVMGEGGSSFPECRSLLDATCQSMVQSSEQALRNRGKEALLRTLALLAVIPISSANEVPHKLLIAAGALNPNERLTFAECCQIIASTGAFAQGSFAVDVVQRVDSELQRHDGVTVADITAIAGSIARAAACRACGDLPLLVEALATMVKRFVLRIIQHRDELSAECVLNCLEALVWLGVKHPTCIGLLLTRVTAIRTRFSLPMASRLQDVANVASARGDAAVAKNVVAAVQSTITAVLPSMLQADAAAVLGNTRSGVMVMQCVMRSCPRDPVVDDVLRAFVRHITDMHTDVVVGVMALCKVRGSADAVLSTVLQTELSSRIIPQSTSAQLARVAHAAVQIGLRSKGLADAVEQRLRDGNIGSHLSASGVALLCASYSEARWESTSALSTVVSERLTEVVSATTALKDYVTVLETSFVLRLLQRRSMQMLVAGATSHMASMTLPEIRVVLQVCRVYHIDGVPQAAAARIAELFDAHFHPQSSASDVALAVFLLFPLSSLLGAKREGVEREGGEKERAREGDEPHELLRKLAVFLFEHRSIVMQRHVLVDYTRSAFRVLGPSLHPELCGVIGTDDGDAASRHDKEGAAAA